MLEVLYNLLFLIFFFFFSFRDGYSSEIALSLRRDFEHLNSVETVRDSGDFEVGLNAVSHTVTL